MTIRNKHIIRFSCLGLFLGTIINIMSYRYFIIEETCLKRIIEQNIIAAENYTKHILEQHPEAITKINNEKSKVYFQDKDFINFAKSSSKFLRENNVNLTLYDKLGNKILTQDRKIANLDRGKNNIYSSKILKYLDMYFLHNYIQDNPLFKTLSGEISHSLISNNISTNLEGNQYEESSINSYIPIFASTGKITLEGVIKISTDVSRQWDSLISLDRYYFIIFSIISIFFFIIIIFNSQYAQRIVNQQLENQKNLKEKKNEAEIKNSEKEEFLANVSHELRTPLNAIIGFSEIIMTESCGKIANPQYKEYISDIYNSGTHLLNVINDILDFSKISANKLRVENIEINLNGIISASIRFIKPRSNISSLQIIEDLPKDRIIIYADPRLLKQSLLNLLSNAITFTPAGGSVTVSTKKDTTNKLVHIYIADTGIGMSDQNIPKALSSFGQIDNRLNRKYEGTGLGLPLTKKMIELMGGTFDIKSTLGKGTTITMTFKYVDTTDIL